MTSFKLPKPFISVEQLHNDDLYFYLEVIEDLRGAKVLVRGYGEMLMLSSYSYLGLLRHPDIEQAAKQAIDEFGTGTHGVRLLAGTTPLHVGLEETIAKFKQTEAAVVFSSGYVTNLSALSALVGRGDYVIGDKLNHASLVDGCLFSGATFMRFRHNDMNSLRKRLQSLPKQANKLVVADAVFSMDGDIFNLPDAVDICRRHGAYLMIDEAHSLGVLGATGHGIEEHFGLEPSSINVKMGTLSKTIPSVGGYIAGSEKLVELLKHNGRGFVYSAALPPAQVAAAHEAFRVIEREQWRLQRLTENSNYFRESLNAMGFNTLNSQTAIVPVICGETQTAGRVARHCQKSGVCPSHPSPCDP